MQACFGNGYVDSDPRIRSIDRPVSPRISTPRFQLRRCCVLFVVQDASCRRASLQQRRPTYTYRVFCPHIFQLRVSALACGNWHEGLILLTLPDASSQEFRPDAPLDSALALGLSEIGFLPSFFCVSPMTSEFGMGGWDCLGETYCVFRNLAWALPRFDEQLAFSCRFLRSESSAKHRSCWAANSLVPWMAVFST